MNQFDPMLIVTRKGFLWPCRDDVRRRLHRLHLREPNGYRFLHLYFVE